jgi:hypothetical protein
MPLMKTKKLTTETGWLTVDGLRAGHAESFIRGYQHATLGLTVIESEADRLVVTARFTLESRFTAYFDISQMNAARKSFVFVCKVIDPDYVHEAVLL